jgi:hypothetical protein
MHRDSKLIFESYIKLKEQFAGEPAMEDEPDPERANAMFFLFQVLDPTGALSWMDLYRAAEKFSQDPEEKLVLENIAGLIIAIFCALPNLGTLGAGIGGVGWMGLKGAAKAAVKAGPHAAVPLAGKMLKLVKSTPGGETLMERALKKLLDNKSISVNAYRDVTAVLRKGEISDFKHAENILSGRGGQAGIASVGPGKAGIAGLTSNIIPGLATTAGRATFNKAQGDVDIDVFDAKKRKKSAQKQPTSGTSSSNIDAILQGLEK